MAENCGVGARGSTARTPFPNVTGAALGTACARFVAVLCAKTNDASAIVSSSAVVNTYRVMIDIDTLLDQTERRSTLRSQLRVRRLYRIGAHVSPTRRTEDHVVLLPIRG